MQKKSAYSAIMEKAILKAILPVVGNGDGWSSNMLYLGRVSYVAYDGKSSR